MKDLVQLAKNLLGIRLTTAQVDALDTYEKELLLWNEQVNLTAIRSPEQIRIKHFLDSLTCLLVIKDPSRCKIIDVGTGAGFPGLPLKIFYPSIQLTLVESVGKKANFCRHIIQILGLEGVQVLQDRAENVGRMPEHRQQYDWATARAVAVMNVLVEYLLPLVKVGGAALAMKGSSAPAEAQEAEQAIRLLGGHLRKLVPVTLPGVVEERYLIVVDKIVATPDLYPRRVGQPSKHPIQISSESGQR
jgi:16S rRNA (guanine527-N7)-methyltransferase